MMYIKSYLNNLQEISPINTGMNSRICKDKKYKAFIFDIYGTLLISSSGDVDEAEPTSANMIKALKDSSVEIYSNKDFDKICNLIISDIHQEIKSTQKKLKNNGYRYPEIVIEEIFKKVLESHISKENINGNLKDSTIKKIVFIFELASNKVWPMPGMKQIINKINNANIPLGIVSNAQYYTPLIVNHFLNGTYEETEEISPFHSSFIQYSYKALRGKPDTLIFKSVLDNLYNECKIKPEETLYIGNDMLKDIYTAKECGMETALFAGDKRSLRMREDDKRCKEISSTHVITNLSQLEAFI